MADSGIYEIRNTINGKRYVGSAVSFDCRWNKHQSELRRGVHHSCHLQNAWSTYGEAAFEFKRLVICDRPMLVTYEQAALDAFKPEYNVRVKADSALGVKRSPEFIAKFKAGRAATGGWSPNAETRSKISASLRGRPGRKPTEESIERMRVAQRARDHSCLKEVWARKIGVPRDEATKVKLSMAVAKLSAQQVIEIRWKYANGALQKNLSMAYGISEPSISEIVNRKTYKWVV